MVIQLSYEEVKNDLVELAKASPDYVYKAPQPAGSCVYFTNDGSPSCIVGHVISKHGIKRKDLYVDSADLNLGFGPGVLKYKEIIDVDSNTLDLLVAVQWRQDHGRNWANAVEEAINVIEERV